jgi:ornithine carbamoyltransferase
VLSRFVDAIMIRMLEHDLVELAQYATVPVINGADQAIASLPGHGRRHDLRGASRLDQGQAHRLDRRHQQCPDLLGPCRGRLDFELNIATPEELAPPPALLDWARKQGAKLQLTDRPEAAVEGADCVITDCWVSMGDEEGTRHNLLQPYQVDERLLGRAEKDAIFMHCLPASRGEEVTDQVMDGPQSAVFDEAENRLHAQKGILAWCFGGVAA